MFFQCRSWWQVTDLTACVVGWIIEWLKRSAGTAAALHKPFLWQCLASWAQETSLNQAAVSAGILARNESWLVLGRDLPCGVTPTHWADFLFFPLVISGSTSWAYLLSVLSHWHPMGELVGWGLQASPWQVLLDLTLQGCLQNLCFPKPLITRTRFNNFSIFSAPERNAQKLTWKKN